MIPWTIAHQAPLSVGILQARILSGLPCPPPGDLPNPGIEPRSTTLQVDSLLSEPPREAQEYWSGWPIPSPGDLSDPGADLGSPALQVDSLPAELPLQVYKHVIRKNVCRWEGVKL